MTNEQIELTEKIARELKEWERENRLEPEQEREYEIKAEEFEDYEITNECTKKEKRKWYCCTVITKTKNGEKETKREKTIETTEAETRPEEEVKKSLNLENGSFWIKEEKRKYFMTEEAAVIWAKMQEREAQRK